jgi:ABC-2 type transport system ATP-binding protein
LSHAIEAEGVEKTFIKPRSIREIALHPFGRAERVHALRGVDLAVRTGEIFGLLGPNGAGKTTLLKILSCLVLPDRGSARVGGVETRDEDRVKPLLGLVNSDERSFYWRLSGTENLRFFARLYDVPSRSIDARIDTLLERVGMTEAAGRPFSGYSSGMKQRLAIARALLHDPPILLMDEPTRSLDPAASLALRKFVLDDLAGTAGKTILLATHDLREAEALSDRLAILVSGRVRQIGTVDEVKRWGLRTRRFALELDASGPAPAGPYTVESDETRDGIRRMVVAVREGASFDELIRAVLASGARVRSCDRLEPDLEQAFSRILEDDGAGGEDGRAAS